MKKRESFRERSRCRPLILEGVFWPGVFWAGVLWTLPAIAHLDSEAPLVGPSDREVRMPYGYLGASSEAEAQTILDQSCPATPPPRSVSELCIRRPDGSVWRRVVADSSLILLYGRLNEKLYEYEMLERFAFGSPPPDPATLSRPSCIDEDSPVWQAVRTGFRGSPQRERLNAFRDAQSDKNLAFVLLQHERLSAASEGLNCSGSRSEEESGECRAIRLEMNRIHTGYPLLWPTATLANRADGGGEAMFSSPVASDAARRVYQLIGAQWGRAGSSPEELERLGRERAAEALRGNPAGYSALVDVLERSLQSDGAATEPLASARSGLSRHLGSLRAEAGRGLPDPCAPGLAPRDPNDLAFRVNSMALFRPNLVRQMLLDLAPPERAAAVQALCAARLMRVLRPETDCRGVTRNPGPPPSTSVRRWVSDHTWPYGSLSAYEIVPSRDPATPTIVRMPLTLAVPPENLAEFQSALRSWQPQLNDYFNCQVGRMSPPPSSSVFTTCPAEPSLVRTPPVRFEINVRITGVPLDGEAPPPPSFRVHRCFNSDIAGSDADQSNCERVREHAVLGCMTRGETRDSCMARHPLGDPSNNRENSANLGLNTLPNVLRHEVGHLFGLPDEYVTPPYDRIMNPVGEHNSIMRGSRDPGARLYSRHLDTLLRPASCSAPSP